MTITLTHKHLPPSQQTYSVSVLNGNENITQSVGEKLYEKWAAEQPSDPEVPDFTRNMRFQFKTGVAWLVRQATDTDEPTIEVLLGNPKRVDQFIEALKSTGMIEDQTLETFRAEVQASVAERTSGWNRAG